MIGRLMQLARWLARIAGWLYEARRAWGAVLAMMGVFLVSWAVLPAWEPHVRITGLFLQLMGIATVAFGLHKTRKLFRRPSLNKVAAGWFARFPKFRGETRIVVGTGRLSFVVASPMIYATASPPPEASVQERVTALEKGLEQANAWIRQTQSRLEEEARVLADALESERRERAVEIDGTQKLLEETAVGGLYVEATGILWLVFGVILATIPNEIVNMFHSIVNMFHS